MPAKVISVLASEERQKAANFAIADK